MIRDRPWRRYSVRHLVALLMPMAFSYATTLVGYYWAVRILSEPVRAEYLLINAFLPTISLWSDWGRANQVFRSLRRGSEPIDAFATAARVPLISMPTLAFGVLVFYLLPLSAAQPIGGLVWGGLLLVASGVAICVGNILRQPLLANGDVHRFFGVHLWVTAGLPMIFLVGDLILLATLAISLLFMLHCWWFSRSRLRQGRRPTSIEVLRGDRSLWAFGAMQLMMGASVALEVAIVLALDLQFALAYVGLSRLLQAAAAVVTRPLESGLSAILRGDHGSWKRRQLEALVLAVGSAFGLILFGQWFVSKWFEVAVPQSMSWLVGGALLATILYRREVTILAVAGRSVLLLSMSIIEIAFKLVVVFGLSAHLQAHAVPLGASLSAIAAVGLARLKGQTNRRHDRLAAVRK